MKTFLIATVCFAAFLGLASAQDSSCDGIEENGLLDNDKSCAHYFQCINGIAVSGECPEPLLFDPVRNICNLAEEVNCADPTKDPICEGIDENGLVDNDESCAHFYQCINGVAVSGVCPEPLLFDPVGEICNHAEEVDCTDPTLPPPIEIQCYPDGIEFHPHPYSCGKYIMCFSGWQIELECAPNLHWSHEDGYCNTQDLAECDIERSLCPEVDDPTDLVFIPSSRDCNRYYLCYNQQTIGMNCAPGKHFDPVFDWCDLPEIAGCEVTVTPEPEIPPPIEEAECGEDGIYFLPHPQSCEYYFLCANGESALLQCAPGLHFDIIIRKCTSAETAVCLQMPTDEPEVTDVPVVTAASFF